MIQRGFTNIMHVRGGGEAMEKYFDYYRDGKIISPTAGKGIVVRP
jgi:hypothetical protein